MTTKSKQEELYSQIPREALWKFCYNLPNLAKNIPQTQEDYDKFIVEKADELESILLSEAEKELKKTVNQQVLEALEKVKSKATNISMKADGEDTWSVIPLSAIEQERNKL